MYIKALGCNMLCLLQAFPEWAIKTKHMQKYSNIYRAACATLSTHLILNKNSIPA